MNHSVVKHLSLVSVFALFCTVLGLSACNKDTVVLTSPKDSTLCSSKSGKVIKVKVSSAVCGYGVWGGLWLLPLDNSSALSTQWLQPYSIEKGITYNPKDGEVLTITYTTTPTDDRYKDVVTCMAYPGTSTPVHILCIQPSTPTNTPEKNAIVEIKAAICGTGVWNDLWAWEVDSLQPKDVLKKWLRPFSINESLRKQFAQVQVGEKYKISYKVTENDGRYDSLITCKAYAGDNVLIHILSMEKIGTPSLKRTVILKETGCGTGVYGDRWFYDETTKEYLSPCQFAQPTLKYEQLVIGARYEITYTLSTSKECQNNYPKNINCVWLPPSTSIELINLQVAK